MSRREDRARMIALEEQVEELRQRIEADSDSEGTPSESGPSYAAERRAARQARHARREAAGWADRRGGLQPVRRRDAT